MSMKITPFGKFNKLLYSSFISSIGDKFFSLALSWWVLSTGFEHSGSMLGIILAITAVGTLIFGPLLGALADIYDRKKCMLISMISSSVTLILLILLFRYTHDHPVIMVTTATLIGIFASFFTSSLQSSISLLVSKEYVPKAVSLVAMTVPLSQVIGAAVAGFAIAALGVLGAITIDLASFLLALILIFTVSSIGGPVTSSADTKGSNAASGSVPSPHKESYTTMLKGGFKYLLKERELMKHIIFFASLNLFLSPIFLVMPVMAAKVFNGDSIVLSFMEASFSLGIITASITLHRTKRKFNRYKALFTSVLVIGLGLALIGFISNLWCSYALLFVCGTMLGLLNVSIISIFQMYVPDDMKGRFFSIQTVTVRAVSPLGYALVGFFSDIIGVMDILKFNGAIIFIFAFIVLAMKKIKVDYVF